MKIHLYMGAYNTVKKSGVGQALIHQKKALQSAGVQEADGWHEAADAIQLNTVFPGTVLAALRARLRKEPVVYYGHSTMEDFQNSFVGSNLLAPLFKRWLCFCYSLGDVIITPTPYSKRLLESYGLQKPIYALSNGVDTEFFAPSTAARARFRQRFGLAESQKVVISVGHFMQRKGIRTFIQLARQMPQVQFFWFGYTDPALVPAEIKNAMRAAPANLTFPGYINQADLRDAYCGADAFCFCSHEETEGIVVLEALACGVPTLLRDIPVYEGWLQNGVNVYKAKDDDAFAETLAAMLAGSLPCLGAAQREVALAHSLPAIGHRLREIYAALVPGKAQGAQPLCSKE